MSDRVPDPRACPVCGQPNQCAMERERLTGEPQPPCWCSRVAIPARVLQRVPADSQGKTCVCPACARAG